MYTIGQIEELTGVKSHVLRYWESVIPGFSPHKDTGGRRDYSQHDMEMVLRLKHLIYEKKYTIEGARNQIIRDSDAVTKNIDVMMEIHQLYKELADLYEYVKNAECFKKQ